MSKESVTRQQEILVANQLIQHTPARHPNIRVGLLHYMQERVNKIFDDGITYPNEDVVKLSEAEGIGPKLLIHRRFLYGTQLARHYKNASTTRMLKEFEKDPDYLNSNPALVCLQPLANGSSRLLVADGHHRIRHSSRVVEIDELGKKKPHYPLMPVRVFTFAEYVDLINRSNPDQHLRKGEKEYTEETYRNEILWRASMVEKEMERYTRLEAMPMPIRGVGSIDQLVEEFGA